MIEFVHPSAVYGLCGISKVWRPQKQQSIRLSSRRRERRDEKRREEKRREETTGPAPYGTVHLH